LEQGDHIIEPLSLLLAKQGFTLHERRLFWAILRELKEELCHLDDTEDTSKAGGCKEVCIHSSALYAKKINPSVRELKNAAVRIINRRITLQDTNGDLINRALFDKVGYKKGCLTVIISREVLPFLMNFSLRYTPNQLKSAIALTSQYAQIMYPILCRFLDTGCWYVELAELREFLQSTKYIRYSNFKQRVIQVLLHEINERTDIAVDAKENKLGRHVRALTFRIMSEEMMLRLRLA